MKGTNDGLMSKKVTDEKIARGLTHWGVAKGCGARRL